MRFLAVFLTLITLIFFYLATEWLGALQLHGFKKVISLIFLAAPFSAILWLVLVRWRRDDPSKSPLGLTVEWSAFLGMGFLSFAFAMNVARDFLAFLLYVTRQSETFLYSPSSFIVIFAASTIMLVVGVLSARFSLEVARVKIPITNLPEAFQNFQIAQISDLHVSSTIRSSFVRKVVSRVNLLEPDLIVMTGDIVDGEIESLKAQAEPLKALSAKFGRFYITGNHEYYWGAEPWIAQFKEWGFSVLVNEHRVIEKDGAKLVLAGVPDYMSSQSGGPLPSPSEALRSAPKDAAIKILLAHQPSFAKAAEAAGFDLQLSGHTHGGQFFPWTLVVRFFHQFSKGLGRLGKMWVYVNRGTGYWGPPVRLGSNAEITLIRLTRA